ncbi:MAG: TRAP transporter substrate-binding protein [Pseudomonadota bacterium]
MLKFSRRNCLAAAGAGIIASPFIRLKSASAAEFAYKYAGNVNADHPLTRNIAAAADKIRERTGGRVDIAIFPNSQLGSEMDMLTQVRTGAIEFYTISGLVLASLVPIASINGIGFAFPDYPDVWRAMDGKLGEHVRAAIDKFGVLTFARIWSGGYRQVTSSVKPVRTPADLQGFKIRVPVSPLWTSMFKAFGAAPVSINWGEVYSSLQTRVVDGQETPLVSIESAKLYEVQKYCSLTNHMWDGFWFLANRRAFDRLPPDLREIVVTTINDQALAQRAEVERSNKNLQETLTRLGLVFNATESEPFQEALRKGGFYEEWKGRYGEAAWSLLEESAGRKLS